jgi:arylsulfate sulfotransferase
MTFRQVWQYGEERGAAFYSSNISDVDHLPDTGNRLIMPGNVYGADRRAFVTEVTYPSQAVVFEAIIHFKDMLGNGMGWGQIDLVYRSERMPIYP